MLFSFASENGHPPGRLHLDATHELGRSTLDFLLA
jgi:hypothetical protein